MATNYRKQVKTVSILRTIEKYNWINISDIFLVEDDNIEYECVSTASGGYVDDGYETIITNDGFVLQAITRNKTGTELDLSNVHTTPYNMAAAEGAVTYTTTNLKVMGSAICRINTSSEPTVTGATKIAGATWVTGTDMHMVVQTLDGIVVQYFFLEL